MRERRPKIALKGPALKQSLKEQARKGKERELVDEEVAQEKDPELVRIKEYQNGGEGFIKWCEDNVRVSIYLPGSAVPVWYSLGEIPDIIVPETGKSLRNIWEKQKEVARQALSMTNGKFHHRLIIFCWMRGEGKCQAKGSEVLMFDGTIKKVEDVVVGDLLMGDDNTPRKVLSLASGKEEMFRVVPNKGEPMTVTKDHILSLKGRRRFITRGGKPYIDPNEDKITDISVADFMKQNDSFRRYHMLYRVPVDFPEQSVHIDPYYLGLWLGDGSSNSTAVTTMDKEVSNYVIQYTKELNLRLSVKSKPGDRAKTFSIVSDTTSGCNFKNPLLNYMHHYKIIKNKHIPQRYKANSRKVRLELLAGLIDSDGYLNRNSYQFILKSERLSKDILFIARSLGFHAEIKKCTKTIKDINFSGEYFRVGISGDCSIIPVRIKRKKAGVRKHNKDVLVSGIKRIESAGIQEYYGFMLDGNHRYVTGDFTVTHNSLFACLIQLWKFFCFPKQQIMLGANSKDQVKFVHYDIMRDLILNSPNLLNIVGKKNVQEKEIRLRDSKDNVVSIIRSISSFSGIVSNISGYTFSEMFDMKNPKFFTQLDGSIRNIPNAMGVIDSTVSRKEHILYKLYTTWFQDKDPTLFFSYRCSPQADAEDFWNAQMSKVQLDSYREKFPDAEFAQYFRNTWDTMSAKFLSDEIIDACHYLGCNNMLGMHKDVVDFCKAKVDVNTSEERGSEIDRETLRSLNEFIASNEKRMIPVSSVYSLTDEHNRPRLITTEELLKLADMYDTDFAILAGNDRADPMKVDITVGARTIVTFLAKGLPGSRSNPDIFLDDTANKKYIYLLIGIFHVEMNDMKSIKNLLQEALIEFGSIQSFCSERWGMWDLVDWCIDHDINFEALQPTYTKQREAFSSLYELYQKGYLKTPDIPIYGSRGIDIFVEESSVFSHNMPMKFYGSPEKGEKYGVQDDVMFSLGWTLYGGRHLSAQDFVSRTGNISFGEFYKERTTGDY